MLLPSRFFPPLSCLAFLAIPLLLGGCGSKDQKSLKQLKEQVSQQQQEIQRRQSAAEICEDLFEAEQQRYLRLERQVRMKFADPINAPVLDETTIMELPEDTRLQIQEQILSYQVKISGEVNQLVEMNKVLQRQIAGVGRSVNTEASAIREAGAQQAEELRSEIVASSNRLGQYLDYNQEVAGRIESLIRDVQSFDQEEVNCNDCWGRSLRKAAERESKKQRLQAFSSQLVKDLAGLQNLSAGADGP